MISIIIPAYNAERTIARCLQSIFEQTHRDFEIIVVDDASNDDTWKVLLTIKNQKSEIRNYGFDPNALFLIHNSINQGANAARNRGVREAKGEFLLFCDADLVLRPNMLKKIIRALEAHPKASYAYSSFKFGWKTFRLWPFDAQRLRQMPYIHTTSLIRQEHFPGFDETVKRLQDWDLWLTML